MFLLTYFVLPLTLDMFKIPTAYISLDFVENQTSFMKKKRKKRGEKKNSIVFPKLSSQRKVSTSIINFCSATKVRILCC